MRKLTEQQKKTLGLVLKSGICKNFYLAGETAITIRYGHRMSEDFDFFSSEFFSLEQREKAIQKLRDTGEFKIELMSPDTLIFYLSGVKFSFLNILTICF